VLKAAAPGRRARATGPARPPASRL